MSSHLTQKSVTAKLSMVEIEKGCTWMSPTEFNGMAFG
jgi:hypothetical protein